MASRSWPTVLFVVLSTVSGCRCDKAPPEPESTAPIPSGHRPERCPAEPRWADPREDPEHLVAEILYQPGKTADRNGTGIRVYDDGRTLAYDEVKGSLVDGKIKTEKIPGAWRLAGMATKSSVDAIASAVAAGAAADLEDVHGEPNKPSYQRPTLVAVRKDGKLLRSCFIGPTGDDAQKHVEDLVRAALTEANDATAKKKE